MKKRCHNAGDCWGPESSLTLADPVTVGDGRTEVHLRLIAQGRDFLVLITGGAAHIGAVGVCDGRISCAEVGVVQVPGHREGPLATEAAEILAGAAGRTCTAVVGIHQDNASADEIDQIVANVRVGLSQMAAGFNEGAKA